MVSRGKSKKRREANVASAQSSKRGDSQTYLAPPPSSRDIFAVPAKLRRLMEFRQLSRGAPGGTAAEKRPRKQDHNPEDLPSSEGTICAKPHNSWHLRIGGVEDTFGATPYAASQSEPPKGRALSARKKQYLESKKKSKKRKLSNGTVPSGESRDGMQQADFDELNRSDTVIFGDIVQAPPKLGKYKQKNVALVEGYRAGQTTRNASVLDVHTGPHHRSEAARGMSMAQERLRQAAIDAYRKKNNIEKLGVLVPPISRT